MQTITTQGLKTLLNSNKDIPVINVLPPEKFREGHIPGTVNIPHERDDFTQRVEELTDRKTDPIVVYCGSKECNASPTAAQKLEDAGFTEVFDYEEGAEGWKQAGMEIESGLAEADTR